MLGYSRAQMVIDSLHGKDLEEVIAEGSKLLAGVPSLGSGSTPVAAPVAAPEDKPEAKPVVVESEEDSDADMGLGLFDD